MDPSLPRIEQESSIAGHGGQMKLKVDGVVRRII
jgi:hypothetical protein